ncbi:unnamed protein product [Chrysoparadoxa australica]
MYLRGQVPILQDRLYYVALPSFPSSSGQDSNHYFSIDNELVYFNFFKDFGPLNLGQLYRFCQILNCKLKDDRYKKKVIYFVSSQHAHKRTNASFLIGAWSVLYLGTTPEEAIDRFKAAGHPPFPYFHDASPCVCTYDLTLLDCFNALVRARQERFFDFKSFDVEEYEHYEQVENGDFNWLVNGKFLAFAGPANRSQMTVDGYKTFTPEDYVPYFRRNNVKLVIRLNKRYYQERKFKDAGIDHADLYFIDGSTPSESIVYKFLELCEQCDGAIAVHCKAGLGRTGSCIGCYLMKHHRLTAAEAIAWMRICRPGSVIGPQQQFLEELQGLMWQEGDVYRLQQQEQKQKKDRVRKGSRGQVSAARVGEPSAASTRPGRRASAATASLRASYQSHLATSGGFGAARAGGLAARRASAAYAETSAYADKLSLSMERMAITSGIPGRGAVPGQGDALRARRARR